MSHDPSPFAQDDKFINPCFPSPAPVKFSSLFTGAFDTAIHDALALATNHPIDGMFSALTRENNVERNARTLPRATDFLLFDPQLNLLKP